MPRVNTSVQSERRRLWRYSARRARLPSAYGIAVTGTMVVPPTTAFAVIWRAWAWLLLWRWHESRRLVFIDLSFLSANLLKIVEGGWMPLALGGVVMVVMYTWRRGTRSAAHEDAQTGNAS